MIPIAHQIAEAQAWVTGAQNDAARPGKGQELARLRLERSQAILSTLEWCRDNAERIRAFEAQHKPISFMSQRGRE